MTDETEENSWILCYDSNKPDQKGKQDWVESFTSRSEIQGSELHQVFEKGEAVVALSLVPSDEIIKSLADICSQKKLKR